MTLSSASWCSSASSYKVVKLNGQSIWNKAKEGRFPQSKELKRLVRNVLDPEKDLGHSDDKPHRPLTESTTSQEETVDSGLPFEDMTDDEAEEMRQFFGVM